LSILVFAGCIFAVCHSFSARFAHRPHSSPACADSAFPGLVERLAEWQIPIPVNGLGGYK